VTIVKLTTEPNAARKVYTFNSAIKSIARDFGTNKWTHLKSMQETAFFQHLIRRTGLHLFADKMQYI